MVLFWRFRKVYRGDRGGCGSHDAGEAAGDGRSESDEFCRDGGDHYGSLQYGICIVLPEDGGIYVSVGAGEKEDTQTAVKRSRCRKKGRMRKEVRERRRQKEICEE